MTDKTSKLLFVFSAIACVALRIFLKLTAIDPATGFYEGGGLAVTVQNFLLAAAVAAMLLLGFVSGRGSRNRRSLCMNSASRVLALLTGLSAAAYGISGMADKLAGLSLPSGSVPMLIVGMAGLLLQFAAFFLAPLATAVLFLWISAKGGDQPPSVNGWLALAPLLWQIGLLLTTFMRFTAIRSSSDQMLTVVTMVFIAPFLLAHARWVGNIGRGRGLSQMLTYGLPFALLSLSLSAGVLAAFFANRTVDTAIGLPAACFYLCAGAYATALCLSEKESARAS